MSTTGLFLNCLFLLLATGAHADNCSAPSVGSYTGLRDVLGVPGQVIIVDDEKTGGYFEFQENDPYGNGEDGGIVFQAENGWWVRQFEHSAEQPIELDWFQLSAGDSVSSLMIRFAEMFSPKLIIKMPSSPMVLVHDSGFVNWSLDYQLSHFILLESEVETAIKVTNADAQTIWQFQDMEELVIGTTQAKPNREDFTFTLIGPWTWENRGTTDIDGFARSVPMVRVLQNTNNNANLHLRFDTSFPLSCSIYVGGNGDRNVYIAGMHRYGGCISTGGQYNGLLHFEDVYLADELGAGVGWAGGENGDINRALGHWRGNRSTQVSNGQLEGGILQITGSITAQYGAAGFNFFFVDKFGHGSADPLTIRIKDYGWTGPNELGMPVGVSIDRYPVNIHPIKSDGLGAVQQGWRYLRVEEENQWGRNPKWPRRIWFAENAQCDDVPSCNPTYTVNTSWTYVNIEGNHYYQNGVHSEDTVGGNVIQGDGKNPAVIGGTVVLVSNDIVKNGKFDSISIATVTDVGPPYFANGEGNSIENVTLTGTITLGPGTDLNTARNVTFIGQEREVINIAEGSTFSISNLCAPAGSTVVGQGTLSLNAKLTQLPHNISSEDCLSLNPDIPPAN